MKKKKKKKTEHSGKDLLGYQLLALISKGPGRLTTASITNFKGPGRLTLASQHYKLQPCLTSILSVINVFWFRIFLCGVPLCYTNASTTSPVLLHTPLGKRFLLFETCLELGNAFLFFLFLLLLSKCNEIECACSNGLYRKAFLFLSSYSVQICHSPSFPF